MPQTVSRLRADLTIALVSAIWGAAFLAQTVAGKNGLAFLYNGASFVVGGLALLPLTSLRGLPRAQWKWMLIAGFLLFGGSALQQVGLFYTKVANASFLTSLYVIFTPFLLWAAFREKPGMVHLAATALAVAGAFFLSFGAGEAGSEAASAGLYGDVLETLGALFWGVHLILVGKYASRFEPISFAAGQFLLCGVLNFAAGSFHEPWPLLASGPVLGAIAFRGLLSIGVGYTTQVWAQRYTPPTDAALIFSLESVFAAAAAALVLGERLTGAQLGGCALILLAASLSQVKITA